MEKILNPNTGNMITYGGAAYRQLIKDGYQYNSKTHSLVLNEISTSQSIITHNEMSKSLESYEVTILNDSDYIADKIVHISDVHIPLRLHSSRKKEYLEVFDNLYAKIRELSDTNKLLIVITGDLLHVKLSLEAETIIMARDFLKTLSELAPTISIIGNHDFAENNRERIDTMSAIGHNIPVYLLKHSGLYRYGNIIFAFSSLFDNIFIKYSDIIANINTKYSSFPIYALFHGTVVNSVNYNGKLNTLPKDRYYPSISDFDGYTGALLGHIHKHQKLSSRIAYAGSLLQQNYGEPITGHGILIWDINASIEFVEIENNYAYINLILRNGKCENLDELIKYANKKLRIKCKIHNTSTSDIDNFKKELSCHIEEFLIVPLNSNSCVGIHGMNTMDTGDTDNTGTNIESINIQNIEQKIISEQIVNPNISQSVIQLRSQLCVTTSSSNINWNIESIEFSNVFIYGNDYKNEINFNQGVWNICSANTTGKTSIVNIILFGLFDKISTTMSNKSNILHIGKNHGYIHIVFNQNSKQYQIKKTIKLISRSRYSTEYFTEFRCITDNCSLNGASVTETLKNIIKYVGDFNTFITYQLISTRHKSSILQLSGTDRIKQFQKLCGVDDYETYVNKIKELRKYAENTLSNYKGQEMVIKNNMSNIAPLNSQQLSDYNQQKEQIENNLYILNDFYQKLLENKGYINSKIIQKQAELYVPPSYFDSSKSIEDYDLEISKLSTTLSTYPSIEEGENIQSINSILQVYRIEIAKITKLLDSQTSIATSDLVIAKINGITKQLKMEPINITDRDIYYIENKISEICEYIKEVTNTTESIDINNLKYDESIHPFLANGEQMDKYILYDMWQTYVHKLNLLEPFIDISPPHIGESEKSLCNFTKNMVNERINNLTNELETLNKFMYIPKEDECTKTSENDVVYMIKKHVPDLYDLNDIQTIVNHGKSDYDVDLLLTYVQNSMNEQNYKLDINMYNLLQKFLTDVVSGSYTKYAIANDQLREKTKHNDMVMNLLAENEKIDKYNLDIERKHNYIIRQKHIEKIEKCQNELLIMGRYNKYLIHKNNLERSLLESRISIYRSQIINICIDEYKSLSDKYNQYKLIREFHNLTKQVEYLSEYNRYDKLIKLAESKIKACEILQSISELEECKKSQSKLDGTKLINHQIFTLEEEVKKITTKISEVSNSINEHNTAIQNININIQQQYTSSGAYQQYLMSLNELQLSIQNIEYSILIYNTYEQLFHRTNIPNVIMEHHLKSFDRLVNEIFNKYTKYSFSHELSDSGKLLFNITSSTGHVLDSERLSGFESIILDLAINNAMINISNTYRCGLIMIDEALDCIDQNRFVEELPKIIDTLRQHYHTIITISQRDIPEHLIDYSIKINAKVGYSTIQ